MGSPFQCCNAILQGNWVPELGRRSWLPLYASSSDGQSVALVQWDVRENLPGFRIVFVDEVRREVRQSERILGCCTSLKWYEESVYWESFHDSGELSNGSIPVPSFGN